MVLFYIHRESKNAVRSRVYLGVGRRYCFRYVFWSDGCPFFLIAQDELTAFLERDIRNHKILVLVESALSTALSLVVASFIEKWIPFHGMKHVVLDCVGIFLGTLMVAFGYTVYVAHT